MSSEKRLNKYYQLIMSCTDLNNQKESIYINLHNGFNSKQIFLNVTNNHKLHRPTFPFSFHVQRFRMLKNESVSIINIYGIWNAIFKNKF